MTSPQILPKYLDWWLNLQTSQKYLNQNVEGTVTKSIRRPVLQALPIKIPSLSKQENIISIAETVKQERFTATGIENRMTGTGSKRLNPKDFLDIEILVPSLKEQQKIAEILTTADQEIKTLQRKLGCLKLEKRALMQKLL